ncbi:tautomerase family protein [Stenoxybacter acetivorans]|uniref:tautomerase family protein n=1 Tax=Stenoxybacter acetivorans TaxID=422441 RepID=UPI00068A4D28|nr:tautomerase family protein [Stenoxybacter acetivorans]
MPIVKVEESTIRSITEQQEIISCIFKNLKNIFGVADEELQARYQYFSADTFYSPSNNSNYIHIEIILFKGRSLNAKRKLYKQITIDLASLLNILPKDILILLNEQVSENWGMHGGLSADEIDFGYNIFI